MNLVALTISDVGFWTMIIGGLGLFLYGIVSISRVLKRLAAKKLRNIITKFSNNRIKAMLTGALFTGVVQSSGATSALTIGLVRAGVFTLLQASAILIGANIGTAITAFIISIPLAEWFPLVLFIGSAILLFATKKKSQDIGELCFAFGALFFGLWLMSMNLEQLANEQWFTDLFTWIANYPWLGLVIGMVMTVALQSSSAVVGVMQTIYAASIVAGVANPITLFGVLPIVFGANIGTTSTALISSLGGSKESKRVALFHLFFNVVGALIFMILLYVFKDFLNTSPTWSITPKLQIAFTHLIFNGATALLFLPLLNPICKLLTKIVPGEDKSASLQLQDLDKSFILKFPSEGIAQGKERVIAMFEYCIMMFENISSFLDKPTSENFSFIKDIEASIDRIDRQLNEYLMLIDKGILSSADLNLLTQVLKACKDIERIGDYGENLIDFYNNTYERKEELSNVARSIIDKCQNNAISLLKETLEVYKAESLDMGVKVIQERRELNADLDRDINSYFDLKSKDTAKKASYISLVFVDIMNSYQRVYSHCSNIAKLYGTDKVYEFDE